MFKKIILLLVVLIEILSGSFFLFDYYQKESLKKKILGVETVATIDKSKTSLIESKQFKYYWQYNPGDDIEDFPVWLPDKVINHINDDGLNDRYDYQIEKKPNIYRIITLGDSFTYGHFVDTKNNWTEQLEDLLNNYALDCQYDSFEVINLGMPGYDIPYIVQRYKEVGQKYDPDLILWFESGSGFYRLNEFLQPIIEDCLDTELAQKKDSYRPCWDMAEDILEKKYSLWDRSEIFKEYYDDFFNLVDMKKTNVIYYKPLYGEEKDIADMWQERYSDAKFIPLVPTLKEEELLLDGHPNKDGHQSMAKHIFEYLKSEKNICEK